MFLPVRTVLFNKVFIIMFKHTKSKTSTKGFTLIEVLIVIGIIAILAAIVIVAINPARQFAQARNAQRQSNINAILNAVGQRIADNKGLFPAVSGCDPLPPSTAAATSSIFNGSGGAGEDVNLSCLTPTYIPSFPTDPTQASLNDTGYDLRVDSSGRVIICTNYGLTENSIENFTGLCVKR
jgi:prepilin-type N-terminal cleavage/methylation domain-containing protein